MSDPLCAAQPNIILFLADDMGMGDTSAYQDWSGNADRDQLHTPALERLANRGIRFTDAHSPSSRCSPSRYALLTGRYCWRTHLKHWVLFGVQVDPLIERERVTLPEFLQDAAYRTGMVGKWHLGLKYHNRDGGIAEGWEDADLTKPIADGPLDHGFDFYYGMSRSHGTSGPDGEKGKDPKQSRGPGWIHNRKIVGATGTGKTFLACALAHKACLKGYSVRYERLSRLLESLHIARADGTYPKRVAALAKTDVLLIDDFGLSPIVGSGRNDLLDILEDRNDVRSTTVTSQLPVNEWHAAIGDDTLADAILDRVVHNSHRITLKGDSMRKKRTPKIESSHPAT